MVQEYVAQLRRIGQHEIADCLEHEHKKRIAAEATNRRIIEHYAPITHGRWIRQGNSSRYMCSECKTQNRRGTERFCPECGARMQKGVCIDGRA